MTIHRQLKKELREKILRSRDALLIDQGGFFLRQNNLRLNLLRLVRETEGLKSLVIFCGFGSEPQPFCAEVIHLCEALKVALFLPKIQEKELVFCQVSQHTTLFPNRFNIMEPQGQGGDSLSSITERGLTLCIAPCVAVDKLGVRLGYGGGYYDRAQAQINDKKNLKVYAAVWDEFFFTESTELLPAESHDVAIQGVVTDKRVMDW